MSDDRLRLRDLTLAELWAHIDHAALRELDPERVGWATYHAGAAAILQFLTHFARLDDLAKRDEVFAALLEHWRREVEAVLGRSYGPDGVGPKSGHA